MVLHKKGNILSSQIFQTIIFFIETMHRKYWCKTSFFKLKCLNIHFAKKIISTSFLDLFKKIVTGICQNLSPSLRYRAPKWVHFSPKFVSMHNFCTSIFFLPQNFLIKVWRILYKIILPKELQLSLFVIEKIEKMHITQF